MAGNDIQAWANQLAQQLFDGPQDIANETANNVTDASGLAFFVGKPSSNNNGLWELKKLTPTELSKVVYNYLTSANVASQLAQVLGEAQTLSSGDCNNITAPGVYDLKRNVLNQPFSYTTMVVYKRGNTIHQVGYDADNNQSAYRLFDGTTWKPWARTDNFGCNTLAELKAALANV